MNYPIAIEADSFQIAWAKAMNILQDHGWEFWNLVVNIRCPLLINEVFHQKMTNFADSSHLIKPNQVAYTIFPFGLCLNGIPSRDELYKRFWRYFQFTRTQEHSGWGTYFERMIRYVPEEVEFDQLGNIIDKIKNRVKTFKAAYLIVIPYPYKDSKRTRGGPCLNYVTVQVSRNLQNGHKVIILEKNEKLGKKLFITGKGRCNLTNACDRDTFFEQVMSNPKFLYSAFHKFNNYDTMGFFEELGLPIKTERGLRVFPESDKSSDVIAVLKKELDRLSVDIRYHCEADGILSENGCFQAVCLKKNRELIAGDAVIIATGGISYPLTGSTGDGYTFAKAMGHTVTELYPSLVPVHVSEPYVKELMGLSLKNSEIVITSGLKEVYRDFGELLFTHFGVSGPVILSASSYLIPYLKKKEELILSIDLKPALTPEQLDNRILRDFEEFKNKQFKNSLDQLLPNKLIDVIIRLSEIDPEKKVNSVIKEERLRLVMLLKHMTFHITKLSDYNQAVITKGGISTREIDPSTMESKIIKKVYFAGEVLDVDALTGGFNLQIAWSSAYLAGSSV
jgi:predicted Rossmann fold flavoprotein